MKNIVFESKTMPEALGYPDRVAVCNGSLLYHGDARCSPNPRKPWIKGGAPWRRAYGFVQLGEYRYECLKHRKYGKCLVINGGTTIKARFPNVNQRGTCTINGVFVHRGWSPVWPGSGGCLTIPPTDWSEFINCFAIGELGPLKILSPVFNGVCAKSSVCSLYEPVK